LANFPERLKELRTETGLTQEQLGERIGVQRMTIIRWEGGSNPPSDENLLLLAQLFKTSTLYLRGDIDDRDMVLTDDWEETEELVKKADEELLLGVYRLLSPEMKRFVQSMTRNALYTEREKEKKQTSQG
jgi:transcriptional regulator with XRE-family HTH domain